MAKNKKKECVVQTDMSDIRIMTYDGELWYNAADIKNHLMSLMGDMVSIKECAEQLTNELKEGLQDER